MNATRSASPRVDRVTVTHRVNRYGIEELVYWASALGGQENVPQEESIRMSSDAVVSAISEVGESINRLLDGSIPEAPMRAHLVSASDKLGSQILPKYGLTSILNSEADIEFDVHGDVSEDLPWEVITETAFRCERHAAERTPLIWGPTEAHRFCRSCGDQLVASVVRLALDRKVTYVVRGQSRPAGRGRRFVLVIDPTDDLSRDRTGVCARHVTEIDRLLKRMGFEPDVYQAQNATASRFLSSISAKDTVGVYYFGHGDFRGGQGILLLSDRAVGADEIERVSPTPAFAFLNACKGAQAGMGWQPGTLAPSVAHRFAHGGGRVVIASRWPVISTDAAMAATEFFEAVARHHLCCGDAMQAVRLSSFGRYQDGVPDICWMSYRYFGPASAELPSPDAEQPWNRSVGSASAELPSPDAEQPSFGFDMPAVLEVAAKRAQVAGRDALSPPDLLVGLVRRGELTRFALRLQNISPDALADTADSRPAAPDGESNAEVGRTIPGEHRVDEATRALLAALDNERSAKEISERRTLEAILDAVDGESSLGGRWPELARMMAALEAIAELGFIDDNGLIDLSCVDEQGRRVLEEAHTLAQTRGVSPISHRVLLAAFLARHDGEVYRWLKAQKQEPRLIYEAMVRSTPRGAPVSFPLGAEAGRRILIAALTAARRLAADANRIGAMELFRGFIEVADTSFVSAIKESFEGLELPARETSEGHGGAGEELSQVLSEAAQIVHAAGGSTIRRPHLLVALFRVRPRLVGAVLFGGQSKGGDEHVDRLLTMIPRSDGSAGSRAINLSTSAQVALAVANQIAQSEGRITPRCSDMLLALTSLDSTFFAQCRSVLGPKSSTTSGTRSGEPAAGRRS